MKFHRSTYFLIGVTVLFLGALIWWDSHFLSTDEVQQKESRLFSFPLNNIDIIRLTRPSETVVLRKESNGSWKIEQPFQAPASAELVQELLTELVFAEVRRTIPLSDLQGSKKASLKAFGLEPPTQTIELIGSQQSFFLALGHDLPSGDFIYARQSKEEQAPVLLVRRGVKEINQLELDILRSRAVFVTSLDKVSRITMRKSRGKEEKKEEWMIELDDKGQWFFQRPLVDRANDQQVRKWLDLLGSLRIETFVADDGGNVSKYGLATPNSQITIVYGDDDKETTLLIGRPIPGKEEMTYAKILDFPTVFSIPTQVIEQQLNRLPQARDRQLVTFVPEAVEKVTIRMPFGTIKLFLDKEQWWLSVPENPCLQEPHLVDEWKLYDFLRNLHQAKVVEFVKDTPHDLSQYGLAPPEMEVELEFMAEGAIESNQESTSSSKEAKRVITLIMGGKEEGNALVNIKVKQRPFVYGISQDFFQAFPSSPYAFLESKVLNGKSEELKTVTVKRQGKAPLRIIREEKGMFSSDQEQGQIDGLRAEILFSLLSQLRAQQWLGPIQECYQLDHPKLTFELEKVDGSLERLSIGAPLPNGNRVAQKEGNPLAFELSSHHYLLLDQKFLLQKSNSPGSLSK